MGVGRLGGKRRIRAGVRVFPLAGSLLLALVVMACGSIAPRRTVTPSPTPPATPTHASATVQPETPTRAPQRSALDSLYDLAKAEGALTTIGLPHDWCNYGTIFNGFKRRFPGITVNEMSPDAIPGTVMEALRVNEDDEGSQVPDVIDVRVTFAAQAQAQDLLQPYRVEAWDEIPPVAKDPNAYWYGNYFGVMTFMVNTDILKIIPQDWADLLEPEYKSAVALSGDPHTSNQAIQAVLGAALSNGGTVAEPSKGLEYFAAMNQKGNLVPLVANMASFVRGETPIRMMWDFDALAARDYMNGDPKIEVVVPESGKIADLYVQAISKAAPHPNAAKLWMEYLYSDEAQLIRLSPPGYCHPVRQEVMDRAGKIPPSLKARVPSVQGVIFPSNGALVRGKESVVKNWDRMVGADIKPVK